MFKKKINWNDKYLEDLIINKVTENASILVPASTQPIDTSGSEKDVEKSIGIYDDDSNIDSIEETKEKKDFLVPMQCIDPDYVDDSYNDNFDNDDYISPKKEKSYSCEDCNKSYVDTRGLWRHNKSYHPERIKESIMKKIKKIKKPNIKPVNYTCKKCDESFMTRMHLIAHNKMLHPKRGEEDESECREPGCEFACPNRKGLTEHWFEAHISNKLCIQVCI